MIARGCTASVDFRCGEKSVNFANENARAVMEMAGVPGDLWTGDCSVPVEGLPGLARRILVVLNVSKARKPYVQEASDERQPGKCRVIRCGVTDESIRRRMTELLLVVQHGIKVNAPLTWG